MPDKLLSPSTGLTTSKLQLASATESDVISGKTFYSGSKSLRTGTLSGSIIDNSFNYYTRSGQYEPCWKNYSINIGLGYWSNIFPQINVEIGNRNAALSSSGTLKIEIVGGPVLLNTRYWRPASNTSSGGPSHGYGFAKWTYEYMNQIYSGNTLRVSVLNNTDDDALYVTLVGLGK